MLYYPVQRISADLEHAGHVVAKIAVKQEEHTEARQHVADDAPPRLYNEDDGRYAEIYEDDGRYAEIYFIAERLRAAARDVVEEYRDISDATGRGRREQPIVPRRAHLRRFPRSRVKQKNRDDGERQMDGALNSNRYRRDARRVKVEQRHRREPARYENPLPAEELTVAALLVVFLYKILNLRRVHAHFVKQRSRVFLFFHKILSSPRPSARRARRAPLLHASGLSVISLGSGVERYLDEAKILRRHRRQA